MLLAGVLALFVVFPLLQPGLPGTADTPIHFYRTLEYARSWGPGVLYPRWAPDLAYGYGHPLWNFAPPLPYLIPLAFQALGFSLEAGLKGLVILTGLGYALGAYLLVRDSLGPAAGLVAAAVYTLAPFALREVLLYGGNYPQYLAIGLYPWVLWALRRTVLCKSRDWFYVLLTALLYGAVILSHLFHALVLTPVAAVYAGVLWLSGGRDLRRLGAAALSLGLGLLWTAFFWLPALVERRYTRAVEDVYVKVSPFYLRFLSWRELLAWPQAPDARSLNPWVPFTLGPIVLLLAGLGLVALVRHQRISKSANPQFSKAAEQQSNKPADGRIGKTARVQGELFLCLLALSVFMTLPISNWVWANVPFLAVAEFPWRWLGLANLSLAYLAGASIVWVRSSSRQMALALVGTMAVLLFSSVYLYPVRPFVRYGETLADMLSFELGSRTIGTTTLGEYLPRWVASAPVTSPLAEALTRGDPFQRLDQASIPEGAVTRLLDQNAVGESYRFDSPGPLQARFLIHFFPGWTAELDGQPVEIDIEPETGLITIPITAGSHELRLRFGDTRLRTAANVVTALTLVGIAVATLWLIAYRERRSPGAGDQRSREESFSSAPSPLSTYLLVGGVLIGLLLLKALVIDPHTGWFRRESPDGQVGGVQHPLRVYLEDRVWLLGYDLDRESVSQGDTLRVVVYWQAQRPLDTDYRSFVHLDAPPDQRTWAGSDSFHPGDATAQIELPTSTWDTAHYVRDEHLLRIPHDVPPATFNLRAGLYDRESGQRLPIAGQSGAGDTIALQTVQVTPGQGLRPADVPNSVSFQLGEDIQLLGHDWDPDGSTLTLYWRPDQPLATDYIVFVHLLDGQGQLVWGSDGPPLGGLYPTSAWRHSEIVVDPRSLALDGAPPGAYTLAVGLYHPDTLVRLPVTDAGGRAVAGDAVPLTRLTWP